MKRLLQTILLAAAGLAASTTYASTDSILDDFYYAITAPATEFSVNGINYSTIGATTCCVTSGDYSGDITIPKTVTYGGTTYTVESLGSFGHCPSLTSITIPSSIRSIAAGTFEHCAGLRKIEVASDNRFYRSVSGVLYTKDMSQLVFYSRGSIASHFEIPNSVAVIKYDAFKSCARLTSVTIPNSVTTIGGGAFEGCTGLTSVAIPNSVTTIEDDAFRGCTNLSSVALSYGLTKIGGYAFEGCTNLTSISIPASVTDLYNYSFANCSGLTSVTLSNRITSIPYGCFLNCTSLSSITIPSSVTSIAQAAFFGCKGLKKINLLNTTPPKLDNAFYRDTEATAVVNVPNKALRNYKAADNWSRFTNIRGADVSGR